MIHLEAIGELPVRFEESVARLCATLSRNLDLDPEVAVTVTPDGTGLAIVASLPDGRSATRHVETGQQLEFAILALATAPPRSQTVDDPTRERPSPSRDPWPAQSRPHVLGFSLGGAVGLHVAGPYLVLAPGLDAYAGIEPGAWQLAVTVRWYPLQAPLKPHESSLELDALGAGFSLLRHFGPESFQLGVGGRAAILLETQTSEDTDGEHGGTATNFQIGLLTRARIGRASPRWTAQLELNVSPARLRRTLRIDPLLPPLPSWEIGAAVGAEWPQL
jgi:hypothetical protein